MSAKITVSDDQKYRIKRAIFKIDIDRFRAGQIAEVVEEIVSIVENTPHGYSSVDQAVHDLHLRGARLRYTCQVCGKVADE